MSKPKTFNAYKQGIFRPINTAKCLNKGPVIFRSSLEQKLMLRLDKNPAVLSWNSEGTIIPYNKPGPVTKPARYFVDFYMKIKLGEQVKEFLIEVKPYCQCKRPTLHGNKKKSTILYESLQYAINTAKWEAADNYCKRKGYTFIIITEKNIETILGKG